MQVEYKVINRRDSDDFQRDLNDAGRQGFKILECGFSRAVQVQQCGLFSDGSYYYPKYWAIMEKFQEG